MVKNERGVTIVTLVVIILVMFILVSITITASGNLRRNSKIKNLQTNMLLIQAKAEEIYNKKEYGTISSYPGETITDSSIIQALGNDSDNSRHLKKGDETAKSLGLEVDSDDYYVNFKTGEVYSKTGFEGKHLLSELKNY